MTRSKRRLSRAVSLSGICSIISPLTYILMKIIVDNLAVEYDDQGQGPSILMLHGWKDSLHSFDPLLPELIKQFRVVRPDLPGFGGSEAPKAVWDLEKYVQFIENFTEKLGVSPGVVVGHSMGGRICIKGLSTGQFKMKKVVLIASAGVANRKTLRNRFFNLVAKIGKVVSYIPPFIFWREGLRKALYRKAGSDFLNAGQLKDTFLKIINEDLSESSRLINSQTLLVWGEKDTETPLTEAKKLSQLIPNSKLITIKEAGHFVHREMPEQVAQIITDFIQ